LQTSYDIETKTKACELAKLIERYLNDKHKDQKGYSDKARSIIFNLRDPKNPTLKWRVLNEEVTAMEMVTLGPKELAS